MNEKTIRKLVKLVEASEIESLTVRNWWTRVQIVKKSPQNHTNGGGGNGGHTAITVPRAEVSSTLPPAETQAAQQASSNQQAAAATSSDTSTSAKEITSPMVGTFYTSPEPGAPAFAEAGQKVTKGQTVCIIEAMKLMNEIEAEFDGTIVKRLAENAEPVEFGQALFLVEPS